MSLNINKDIPKDSLNSYDPDDINDYLNNSQRSVGLISHSLEQKILNDPLGDSIIENEPTPKGNDELLNKIKEETTINKDIRKSKTQPSVTSITGVVENKQINEEQNKKLQESVIPPILPETEEIPKMNALEIKKTEQKPIEIVQEEEVVGGGQQSTIKEKEYSSVHGIHYFMIGIVSIIVFIINYTILRVLVSLDNKYYQ
ncbi:hypothetical protein EDI_315710 [Entamoeba dispar SAW760]|uniref:Uncharacterized protein n=1 Tax=Entamoeba dispar (strain ATCC PRA-260 / SAW760) TaxID=370354 RepID=B0EAF4_ENTDS|nr:uncharacterized protein EDI_315710 [Entamoeba dispar SAW760]EDR28467.1 hypothetical protein EDI_315710 [Entamoeba dispar SAW760]|eukprot:EDR28467.1 hypothetical protein EDI_315710 [Entamoeba dispar SAW760]